MTRQAWAGLAKWKLSIGRVSSSLPGYPRTWHILMWLAHSAVSCRKRYTIRVSFEQPDSFTIADSENIIIMGKPTSISPVYPRYSGAARLGTCTFLYSPINAWHEVWITCLIVLMLHLTVRRVCEVNIGVRIKLSGNPSFLRSVRDCELSPLSLSYPTISSNYLINLFNFVFLAKSGLYHMQGSKFYAVT